MLLTFFMLFCAIVASAGYFGWRYYNQAMRPVEGTLLIVHVNAGVAFQPKGSAQTVSLERQRAPCLNSTEICKPMTAGSRVKAKPEAGYGPVASIVLLDQTQIDLSAHPSGADLMLDRYRVSRWTRQRQEVVLRQDAGYVRYDLKGNQPYAEVTYTVVVTGGVRVLLTPGGSYSINVPGLESRHPIARTASSDPLLVEVAVRAGSAVLQSGGKRVLIGPKAKAKVDTAGNLAPPMAAEWELIDDGDFAHYRKERYDDSSDAWIVVNGPAAQNMADEEKNGTFTAEKQCPPLKVDFCKPDEQVYVGRFLRRGNQRNSFITGIEQDLDADVSEYTRTLELSAWVRVLTQTVELAGIAGSECPIMIKLTYKQTSPTDAEQYRTTCVYSGSQETTVKAPEINYIRVEPYKWQPLKINLRDDPSLQRVRYLQKIRIYANGHDYLAEITHVSLIGKQ